MPRLDYKVDAKSCIIEKDTTFTHFVSKLLHISASKILHIYPLATITVHIYTVTVACVYNILIIFDSLLFFSLFSICKTNPPSLCSFFLWYTKSKINYKHKKSTTNIKNQPQNQPLEQNHWIGDRWCGLVLMEIGDGLTVLLGWRRSVDWKGVVVLVMAVVLMEFLLWCFWVLNVRGRRRKKRKKRKRKQ